jgi:thiol-disulfide isomerase/thioredoxin
MRIEILKRSHAGMRTKLLFTFIYIILFGCANKRAVPDFYKNLYTGEILSKTGFEKFQDSIYHLPSLKGDIFTRVHFYELLSSDDSIIQPFKYDLRIDDEYVVRAISYQKIGTEIIQQQFVADDGDTVQIGGRQAKPTLINLWFVGCRGCVEELPSLNKLQAKYGDKVNFIAITFDEKNKVAKFLEKHAFNFEHVTSAGAFIKKIETYPYPENIFINRAGYIVNIEGGLVDFEVEYFESIIEKMLQVESAASQR